MQFIQKRAYCHIWFLPLMLLFLFPGFSPRKADGSETRSATPSHYFTATYFHGSFRCATCQQIETLSAKAINNNFANELKTGSLVWGTVNVDEPDNRHFVKDYQLYTRSLIITEIRDEKEVRWKNLEKVWGLVRNEEEFNRYVSSEIRSWMGQ
jgi:hypothetical protein